MKELIFKDDEYLSHVHISKSFYGWYFITNKKNFIHDGWDETTITEIRRESPARRYTSFGFYYDTYD